MKLLFMFICFVWPSSAEGTTGDPGGPTGSSDSHTPAPPRMRAHELSIGSHPADKGQFPYIVSLQQEGEHFCGGSILTSTTILTAAHCLSLDEKYEVVAGEHNLKLTEGTEQRRVVERFVIHRNFKRWYISCRYVPFSPNDIALMLLKEPLVFNEFVKPATLPPPGSGTSGNVVLAGWGVTEEITLTKTDVLLTEELPMLNQIECLEAMLRSYGPIIKEQLMDSILCTGPLTGGKAPCIADSGSPLVQDGVLVGVVTWASSPCGEPNHPSGFTRVSSFIDWIERGDRLLRHPPRGHDEFR